LIIEKVENPPKVLLVYRAFKDAARTPAPPTAEENPQVALCAAAPS